MYTIAHVPPYSELIASDAPTAGVMYAQTPMVIIWDEVRTHTHTHTRTHTHTHTHEY